MLSIVDNGYAAEPTKPIRGQDHADQRRLPDHPNTAEVLAHVGPVHEGVQPVGDEQEDDEHDLAKILGRPLIAVSRVGQS